MILVYAYWRVSPVNSWVMKYDSSKFGNIGTIAGFLGREICSNIIKLHAITGCDTTSYFYRVGKISPLKKVIKESESLNLISALGETMLLGDADVEDCMKFIQTTLYAGCEEATYVETRIRLYKNKNRR